MAHRRRNEKLTHWRSKKANHGCMGARGQEKSAFCRYRRRKNKGAAAR